MSGLFGGKGALGKVFGKRPGSKPLTGIDPAAPGVDRSQQAAPPGTADATPDGRRRRGRTGGPRKALGAQTVMTSTY